MFLTEEGRIQSSESETYQIVGKKGKKPKKNKKNKHPILVGIIKTILIRVWIALKNI